MVVVVLGRAAQLACAGNVMLGAVGQHGVPFAGASISLPDGFKGQVLQQTEQADQQRRWRTESSFSAITYWNHDTHPTSMDGPQRAIEWLALANAVRSTLIIAEHFKATPRRELAQSVLCCFSQMAQPVSSEDIAKNMPT